MNQHFVLKSLIIVTESDPMNTIFIDPIHPGEILLEDFLNPLGISQYKLAKEIGVTQRRISAIVNGKRSITADTDLRLCKFFGLSDGYWLRLQTQYDTVKTKINIQEDVNRIKPHFVNQLVYVKNWGNVMWDPGQTMYKDKSVQYFVVTANGPSSRTGGDFIECHPAAIKMATVNNEKCFCAIR